MRVVKRSGSSELVCFDKITKRLEHLSQDLSLDIREISQKVCSSIYDGIETKELDEISANLCASLAVEHPDFNTLASRLVIDNNHKNTSDSFVDIITKLYNNKGVRNKHNPLIKKEIYELVLSNADVIQSFLDYNRDFKIDYFGYKTLEKMYLSKVNDVIIERPQHMWLRVALGIHFDNLDKVKQTYDLMSNKYFTHATPTLFNSGSYNGNLSSCFEANTLVDTLQGPKRIIDVKVGDEVVTHKGNVKKVIQTHENLLGDRKLYNVNIFKTNSFIATEDHKLWVYDSKKDVVDWKEIQDLTRDDYISIPNYNGKIKEDVIDIKDVLGEKLNHKSNIIYEDKYCYTQFIRTTRKRSINDLNGSKIFSSFRIDNDFMKFLGIWYGDGHIIKKKNKKGEQCITGIGITIEKSNEEMIDFCKHMKDHFGLNNITIHIMKNQNVTQVLFNNQILGLLFNNLFGCGFNGKRLWKNIYKYDNELIYELLSGLISSDGCISKQGIISLCMANETFMREIYTLCRLHNMDVGQIQKAKMGVLAKEQAYRLSITNLKYDMKNIWKTYKDDRLDKLQNNYKTKFVSQYTPIIKDGFKFIKFNSMEEVEPIDEYVYTLGVEDDHSYSIAGIIAQNCFLLGMEDSLEGIFKCMTDCAKISKFAGGIGVHCSNIRANGSIIEGTNGKSTGIMPMLKTFNSIARYINQGGRRNGSIAFYLEPHHPDIFEFLEAKKNIGNEEERARDLFYALWVPDLFMERVEKDLHWSLMCPNECPNLNETYGDDFKQLYELYESQGKYKKQIKAREIWDYIIEAHIETGVPYILFKDSINRKSNQKNIGIIKSSNLCVAPETKILTDKGHIQISTLKDQEVNVWNGEEFSRVIVKQTGVNQKLIKVVLSDGSELECTPYHKFYIQNLSRNIPIIDTKNPNHVRIVEAKDLKPDMKIIKCSYPVIEDGINVENAYTSGLFSGDGTYSNVYDNIKKCDWNSSGKKYCKRHLFQAKDENDLNQNFEKCQGVCYDKIPRIDLYGEKQNLVKHIDYRDIKVYPQYNKTTCILNQHILEKYQVPINGNLKSKLEWFAGLCDADGSICKNGINYSLQVGSIHKKFLNDIKLMLQTCGINSKIGLSREEGKQLLPKNDGSGESDLYDCCKTYRLLISSNGLYKLQELGFKTYRLEKYNDKPQRNAERFVKVNEVLDEDRIDDTYCFTEHKRNAGIFNGIITSQCAEITEVSDSTNYSNCNLASIALPSFLEDNGSFNFDKFEQVIDVVVENLNIIIDINKYPTPETKDTNFAHRPIGIGIQGLADLFALLKLPYDSYEARQLNEQIFEYMYYYALKSSVRISRRDGPYQFFDGSPASKGQLQFDLWNYKPKFISIDKWNLLKNDISDFGLRNSLLIALMPTASTANILGFNSCFEPFINNIFTRRTLAGEFVMINKYLLQELIENNLWDKNMKQEIMFNNGSVQNIERIPENIRNRYKTAFELKQKVIMDLASDRAKFVCQSQSMNLFVNKPTYNLLTNMLFYGWKQGLKTGSYYIRTKPAIVAQKFSMNIEKEQELKQKKELEKKSTKKVECITQDDGTEICIMCSG